MSRRWRRRSQAGPDWERKDSWSAKCRCFDEAGDADEKLGAFRGDAACGDGSGKSAEGAFAGLDGGRARGERSEFAEEVVFAGGAGSEGAVGVAEAIELGMSGQGTAAAVGEGEAAEGSVGVAVGHVEIIY